jgi:ribosomal protein L39E
MNFYAKEETPFLPRTKIIELLKQFNERVPLWYVLDTPGEPKISDCLISLVSS